MNSDQKRRMIGEHLHLKNSADEFFKVVSAELFTNMIHICDFGCGDGSITQWFCNQAPFDENDQYANYTKVSGIDLIDSKTDKFDRVQGDILSMPYKDDEFNMGWCHHTLQQLKDPVQGLIEIRRVMTDYSLLLLAVPQTLDMEYNRLKSKFDQYDRNYYNLPILIRHLAMSGWDCQGGYFQKLENNRNIYAVVKPARNWNEPDDPFDLTMVDLMDRGVLPKSTHKMIQSKNYFDETALLLTWMNGTITDYSKRV
jgi:SAM-dependent methyltransferase